MGILTLNLDPLVLVPVAAILAGAWAILRLAAIADRAEAEAHANRRCHHGTLLSIYCSACGEERVYGKDGFSRCEHGVIGGNACAKCIANSMVSHQLRRVK
jgi:hypothetical protein